MYLNNLKITKLLKWATLIILFNLLLASDSFAQNGRIQTDTATKITNDYGDLIMTKNGEDTWTVKFKGEVIECTESYKDINSVHLNSGSSTFKIDLYKYTIDVHHKGRRNNYNIGTATAEAIESESGSSSEKLQAAEVTSVISEDGKVKITKTGDKTWMMTYNGEVIECKEISMDQWTISLSDVKTSTSRFIFNLWLNTIKIEHNGNYNYKVGSTSAEPFSGETWPGNSNISDCENINYERTLLNNIFKLQDYENGYHGGRFTKISNGNLQWENQAGVSWELKPMYNRGYLDATIGDNYYKNNEGGKRFELLVSPSCDFLGFKFMGEEYLLKQEPILFADVLKQLRNSTFRMKDYKDGSHEGNLTLLNDDNWQWTNNKGETWIAKSNYSRNELDVDNKYNPYRNKQGGKSFHLIMENGKLRGISYMGDLYIAQ